MISMLSGAAAAMLAISAPNAHRAEHDEPPAQTEEKPAEKAEKKDAFDFLKVFQMFDKLFPAQPEPAPARLALSRTTANGLLADGTYGRMMGDMMDTMVDRVMSFSEADFGGKGKDGKPPSTETLRQAAIKEDPHFEERMKIMRRIIGEEMIKISAIIEPKVREGLARSMARRFDEKQLTDINAFLATDSGKAYGRESMAMWFDSDVMRSVFTSTPEIFVALPGAMQRIEKETAHLPKPKKAKKDEAQGKKPAK